MPVPTDKYLNLSRIINLSGDREKKKRFYKRRTNREAWRKIYLKPAQEKKKTV